MAKVLRKDWLLLRPGLLFVSLTFGLLWNWLIWVDDPLAIHYSGSLLTLVFAFYLATMDGGSANMEAFWNSLPISRVELVGAKYLEGVLFAVGGYLLAWILQFPVRWQELARARAGDEFARQRTELADMAFSSETLEEPAQQFGLEVRQRDGVTRDGNQAPFDHAGLVRQLFSADVMEDGFNTELIDINRNTAVVARVRAHHPEAPQPLEEVAAQVRERLESEQTLALLQEKADEILQDLRDGEMSPEGENWTVHNDVVRSESQVPPAVKARAFSLPTPEDGGFTFGSVTADMDLVIIALAEVTDGEVDLESDDVRGMKQFLAQLSGQREYDAYVRTLREKAEIVRP